ncbi:Uma2 family endonuclease [Halothece sp. PCC 7418]|uniref:Uma2 family endonuclease n=1 Tax=Halothece sp. (strain PCC 7418) TaxID=65093 RepID=UPI0005A0F35A|nr:Uma2 family endonuclease [Halothece sp. PCC 7418]
MLDYSLLQNLPTAKDLPDSDDTPVDNELQNYIPNLLKSILAMIWSDRFDWYFGVDMGIYYDPDKSAIVPDGFLSVGVPRIIDENLRLSYVLWEEKRVPILVLEVVSQTRRGEYTAKKELYQNLGIQYYVIYNPQRKRKPRLEVYSLENEQYVLLGNESPIWLEEIGLGIGKEVGTYEQITREWLYWYDENGERFLTPEERSRQAESKAQQAESKAQQAESKAQQAETKAQQAESKAQQAETKAERYARRLRELGIDPDSV